MRSSVLLFALVSFVFASCSSSTAPPMMTRSATLSAASIEFGNTRMGLCADTVHGAAALQMLSITNHGNDSLRIDSIGTSSTDLNIVSIPSGGIAPNASASFQVRYCPSSTGPLASSITIYTNSTDSQKRVVPVTGTGIRYMPYNGSLFTYDAVQLDTGGHPIGQPINKSIGITASNLTYQGKSGVSLTSDDSTYFKVEDNGDLSLYFKGYPTYPDTSLVGAGWFVLPTGSKQTIVHNATYAFPDSSGKTVNLVVTDTVMYKGDTTVVVGGHSLTCYKLLLARWAIYQQDFNALVNVGYLQALFSPELGFTVHQGHLAAEAVIINGQQAGPPKGGGEGRILKSYILK